MLPSNQGSFRLFKVFQIEVFIHWSWFVIAYVQFQRGKSGYENPIWMAWEYLSLFGIVLLHEFGHSLACRSVGGRADQIILWPFGGVAFVQPPHRPGAFLWSIAAGPLVNVVLVPILFVVQSAVLRSGAVPLYGDAAQFMEMITRINLGLLVFNMLPVYPLDGGQIFQSILWYFVGYAKSVLITSGLGFLVGAAVAVSAFTGRYFEFAGFIFGGLFLGFVALFLVSQSWRSFQMARQILKYEKQQRDIGVIDV